MIAIGGQVYAGAIARVFIRATSVIACAADADLGGAASIATCTAIGRIDIGIGTGRAARCRAARAATTTGFADFLGIAGVATRAAIGGVRADVYASTRAFMEAVWT